MSMTHSGLALATQASECKRTFAAATRTLCEGNWRTGATAGAEWSLHRAPQPTRTTSTTATRTNRSRALKLESELIPISVLPLYADAAILSIAPWARRSVGEALRTRLRSPCQSMCSTTHDSDGAHFMASAPFPSVLWRSERTLRSVSARLFPCRDAIRRPTR